MPWQPANWRTWPSALQKRYNHEIKYIDLGGGFPSGNTLKGAFLPGTDTNPGFDVMAEAITTALVNASFPAGKMPLLILETGRALIDDAGYLLGTVISNKRSINREKDHHYRCRGEYPVHFLLVRSQDLACTAVFKLYRRNHALWPAVHEHRCGPGKCCPAPAEQRRSFCDPSCRGLQHDPMDAIHNLAPQGGDDRYGRKDTCHHANVKPSRALTGMNRVPEHLKKFELLKRNHTHAFSRGQSLNSYSLVFFSNNQVFAWILLGGHLFRLYLRPAQD
ncbi:MAG: hypothetical protein MZV63_27185 [Marinilabiliales bacterium]|nr:hypothetical protein [Marinilabiliales bacterium]